MHPSGLRQQLQFLLLDLQGIIKDRPSRWIGLPLNPTFWIVTQYRIERGLYLAIGPRYSVLRLLLMPLLLIARVLAPTAEVSYKADIGPGFRILHPSLGVVVSANSRLGEHVLLIGGNLIGLRHSSKPGDEVVIEESVRVGAGAQIIGPLTIRHHARIASGAVVVTDVDPFASMGGVPAKVIGSSLEEYTERHGPWPKS